MLQGYFLIYSVRDQLKTFKSKRIWSINFSLFKTIPFLSTGQVTDLKGHFVTQVAMGKAHTCVLTKSGEVWTFGVNNKGQCGRDTGAMSQAGKGENIHRGQVHITTHIVLRLTYMYLGYCLCVLSWFSVWCGEHGHSHGWRLGGWARGERREEHDVPARHAQVEVGPVYGVHGVWRLHWLRCQLCQQWKTRQSTRRVRGQKLWMLFKDPKMIICFFLNSIYG